VSRRMRVMFCLTVAALAAVLGTAASAPAASASAPAKGPAAAQAKPRYTHGSDLTAETCPIYENYPKAGVPVRTWTVARTHDRKHPPVGVRYTYHSYAMVLDHTRHGDPHWGFIARSCLTDPYAYSEAGTRLADLRGVGGGHQVKAVPISAAHNGRQARATIHVGSVGTLRSAPQSFPIGNVRPGDAFEITVAHCGHHGGNAWILGYAPAVGRWAYVEAGHLPACS